MIYYKFKIEMPGLLQRWLDARRVPVMQFEKAREWARNHSGITRAKDWVHTELPPGIPRKPLDVYKGKGWKSWADFLGIRQRSGFRLFEEARVYAISLNLISGKSWNTINHPNDIPLDPRLAYEVEWKGWPHFIGTPEPKKVRPFEEAREWARKSGIKSFGQWIAARRAGKIPHDISGRPDKSYAKKGWEGWRHFTGRLEFASYEEISAWTVANGIKSFREWKNAERPLNFPACPWNVYSDQWDIASFFKKPVAWSFDQVRNWARQSGIASSKEWRKSSKMMPREIKGRDWPPKVYRDEWKGWNDFLGRDAG